LIPGAFRENGRVINTRGTCQEELVFEAESLLSKVTINPVSAQ
jgi:cytochrome c-type biogenesis protein CcmE